MRLMKLAALGMARVGRLVAPVPAPVPELLSAKIACYPGTLSPAMFLKLCSLPACYVLSDGSGREV